MNGETRYGECVIIPDEAPLDYKEVENEQLIKRLLWQLKDGFLEPGGLSVEIKLTQEPNPSDFGPYKSTIYRAVAKVSKVKIIHENALQLDAIQHDYRYAKLSEVIKHKFSAWVKGWKK